MRILDLFRTGRPYYQEDSLYLTYAVLFLLEVGAIAALFLTPVSCAPLEDTEVRLAHGYPSSTMAFVNSHCASILVGSWLSLVYFALCFLVVLGLFLSSSSDIVSLLEEQVSEFRGILAASGGALKYKIAQRFTRPFGNNNGWAGDGGDEDRVPERGDTRRITARARAVESAILRTIWQSIVVKGMALTTFLAASIGYFVWLNVLSGDSGKSLGGARTGGVFLCDGAGRTGYAWSTVSINK